MAETVNFFYNLDKVVVNKSAARHRIASSKTYSNFGKNWSEAHQRPDGRRRCIDINFFLILDKVVVGNRSAARRRIASG